MILALMPASHAAAFERCTPLLRDSPTVSVEKWNAFGNPDKGGAGKKTLEKLC
jgi:hypothetical protein